MRIIKSLLVGLLLNVVIISFAQDNGLGVRIMNLPEIVGVGISYKQIVRGNMSYETSVGSVIHMKSAFIKGDFNFIQRTVGIQGLDWYSGIGIQSWFSANEFDIGPELTSGLDLDLVSVPFSLFLDGSLYTMLVNNRPVQSFWQIGAGARFLFK